MPDGGEDAASITAMLVRAPLPVYKGKMFATKFQKPGEKVKLSKISTRPPKGLKREEAEARTADLKDELFRLQELMYAARTHGLLLVLQGRDSAGKDGTIKRVVGGLNPRGVNVAPFGVPTKQELAHDFLWRVHPHTPGRGEVAVFNRSHYEDVLVVRVHGLCPARVWKARYDQINHFEQLLAAHGTVVVKVFLHISLKEQEERLLEREEEPEKAWKLNPNDWKERGYWQQYTRAYQDAIGRCASPDAPWLVVPGDKKWFRNLAVAQAMCRALRPHRKGWLKKLEQDGREGRAAVEAFRTQNGDPARKR